MVLVGEYSSCYDVKECYAYVGIENWEYFFLTLSRTETNIIRLI